MVFAAVHESVPGTLLPSANAADVRCWRKLTCGRSDRMPLLTDAVEKGLVKLAEQ
jgi:hypothetical protein